MQWALKSYLKLYKLQRIADLMRMAKQSLPATINDTHNHIICTKLAQNVGAFGPRDGPALALGALSRI